MNVRTAPAAPPLDPREIEALEHGGHGDPFRVLGMHQSKGGPYVRAFLPGAEAVDVLRRHDGARIGRLAASGHGLFHGMVSEHAPYRLRVTWPGAEQET